MKSTFTLLLIFACFLLHAQNHPSCDGLRYRSDVFAEVSSTTALKFSEGTTIGGNFQELFLDVYEPVGDTAAMRPVIILAFGGSFIFGEREDLDFLCEAYAKKGYVAVTIDYRLFDGGGLPSGNDMREVVSKAVVDMKAAVRYMRADAATDNMFKVDPDLVFVGGVSAGAIAAAHTAVFDSTDTFDESLRMILDENGVFDESMGFNSEYSSEVQGFVNFSGGLNDASWIDAGDPPFVSVHDEFDGIVPYGAGFATIFGFNIIEVEGSLVMQQQGDSVGVTNELMTIEGSFGHVSYFGDSQSTEDAIAFSAEFLYDIICPEFINNLAELPEELRSVQVYPQPTSGTLYLQNEYDLALRLKLYDGLGRMLGQWTVNGPIDLSAFSNGMYFLEVEDMDTRAKKVEKVVIER